ncbi:MAG: DUF4258 domain-containing protein [Candidatus Giovannonibacteria bacterium]|nr:DUF4258 domain-containing protein [Candidatus Giovannonibacteria bacterium]
MIIFTDHALRRMRERKISKAQVSMVLEHPESAESEEGNIKILRKKFENRALEIVIETGKNKIIVVTLYWL